MNCLWSKFMLQPLLFSLFGVAVIVNSGFPIRTEESDSALSTVVECH